MYKSKKSSHGNVFFDFEMKMSKKDKCLVRVMKKTNSGVRRETFVDQINKPVMLSHLTKSSGGAFFFNAYYGSHMIGVKKLDFSINDVEFSSISDVLGQSSGQFNI